MKRFLKFNTHPAGYKQVALHNKGVMKTKNVHRLVALTYIPNPENKLCVDHINRIRIDNRVSNLRWTTTKENTNNIVVGRGSVSYINKKNIKQRWRYDWSVCKNQKYKVFDTKQEAEAYRIIVYQLRCAIRRMRGLNYWESYVFQLAFKIRAFQALEILLS